MAAPVFSFFFFFNDTATTEIYTLSLHDALPILAPGPAGDRPRPTSCHFLRLPFVPAYGATQRWIGPKARAHKDRKSTRLNSSHLVISYAVFCLKKKKTRLYSLRQLVPYLAHSIA